MLFRSADAFDAACHLQVESVERFSGELTKVKAELDSAAGDDRVLIACHNAGEVERLREVFADTEIAKAGRLDLTVGRIRGGFRMIDAKAMVIADHELFARAEVRRGTTRRRYESRAIDSFLDLNEGDLVVHLAHGIGIYRGLQVVEKGEDFEEEQLVLEFAEKTRLFVPIAKVDLASAARAAVTSTRTPGRYDVSSTKPSGCTISTFPCGLDQSARQQSGPAG